MATEQVDKINRAMTLGEIFSLFSDPNIKASCGCGKGC